MTSPYCDAATTAYFDGHPFYIATSPTPAATLPQPLPGAGETTSR